MFIKHLLCVKGYTHTLPLMSYTTAAPAHLDNGCQAQWGSLFYCVLLKYFTEHNRQQLVQSSQ